jgi:hypothetical protein
MVFKFQLQRRTEGFLVVFEKLRKATMSFFRSVLPVGVFVRPSSCPSFHPFTWNISTPSALDFREISYLRFYREIRREKNSSFSKIRQE